MIPKKLMSEPDASQQSKPTSIGIGHEKKAEGMSCAADQNCGRADMEQASWLGKYFMLVVGLQVACIAWALLHNCDRIDPDGVSYIRIAGYFAEWKTDFMISGYWGPQLSWLMVPFLKVGVEPVLASWLVVGATSVFFLLASINLFRRWNLPPVSQALASAIVAYVSVGFCFVGFSPDLLVAAWMLLAIAQLTSPDWASSPKRQVITGLLWAGAYLAKPVAFVLAFAICAAVGAGLVLLRRSSWTRVFRAGSVTMAVFLAASAPWLAALSIHYHHLTFTCSGTYNHALFAPSNKSNDNSFAVFKTFNTPELGRLNCWEEPGCLPLKDWSPLGSPALAMRQLEIAARDAKAEFNTLIGFDWFCSGFWGAVISVVMLVSRRKTGAAFEEWQWGLAPLVMLLGIYLTSMFQPRYLYMTVPLALATALGAAFFVSKELASVLPSLRRVFLVAIAASFILAGTPQAARSLVMWNKLRDPDQEAARVLAKNLRSVSREGPVAGGGLCGFYLSYFMNKPFFGTKLEPALADVQWLKGRVKLLLVRRNEPLLPELRRDPDLHECTSEGLSTPNYLVFEVNRGS